MNEYKVALYNLGEDSDRGAQLHSILDKLSIPYVTIEASELNQRVGYVAGMSGYFRDSLMHTGDAPDCEFMVMCSLPEDLLDKFLEEMMAVNLRINYKAVVTEHNRDYTLIQLLEDIRREHEMYQSYLKLDKLVKQVEALDPFIYGSDREWMNTRQGLRLAKTIMSRDNLTASQLDNVYRSLDRQYRLLLSQHISPVKKQLPPEDSKEE